MVICLLDSLQTHAKYHLLEVAMLSSKMFWGKNRKEL